MPFPFFPHFNRIISAGFLKNLLNCGFLALVAGFFVSNFFSLLVPLSSFQKANLAVLKSYSQSQVHLNLAEEYLMAFDLDNARRELILGLANNPTDNKLQTAFLRVENLINQPEQTTAATEEWEKVSRDYPDFRDAYLRLSQLYFQLHQNEKAKKNLEKALEIDPNFDPAKEMKKIIR